MSSPIVVGFATFASLVCWLWPRAGGRRSPVEEAGAGSRPMFIAGVVGGVVVGVAALGPVPVVALAATFVGARWWRGRVDRAARQASIDDALPETIDLLAVVFGAGGTAGRCLEVLANRGPAAIRPAVARARQQRDAGASLSLCLESLVDHLGPSYRPAVRVLVATERDGAPVATLLERLADESRSVRRRQMEARSRRLPVMLLGPLVACFLPAVVVGTIVPLVLVSIERLTG